MAAISKELEQISNEYDLDSYQGFEYTQEYAEMMIAQGDMHEVSRSDFRSGSW